MAESARDSDEATNKPDVSRATVEQMASRFDANSPAHRTLLALRNELDKSEAAHTVLEARLSKADRVAEIAATVCDMDDATAAFDHEIERLETALSDYLDGNNHDLAIRTVEEGRAVGRNELEALRPVWAQRWTDDSRAAQASSAALAQIWEHLGVTSQTEAMTALKTQSAPENTNATAARVKALETENANLHKAVAAWNGFRDLFREKAKALMDPTTWDRFRTDLAESWKTDHRNPDRSAPEAKHGHDSSDLSGP